MRIRELRLAGFKSFVDPTRMPIETGLTGIVGPNGCGKSNLLEAVRWVMGAASAKALRADDMDSVIFAGSGGRPAREHADVTIVLDDAAGRFAGDSAAETLEVTRRIRREAGSTYKINGRDARAKDVQLLFADASTGANSPALVRQGQISELISAKPENRRRILEEAAGVAGLHARRHEADLKLRAAEANLARVEDSLKDMEQQTGALRRQARQAERYRQIADELRRTEALLAARLWRDAGDQVEAGRATLRAAERAQAQAAETASVSARAAMEAEAKLAPAQEEELIAAAVLRGLEAKRVGLERDAAELAAAAERRTVELARIVEDGERARRDGADAMAAIQRLDAEAAALGDDRADTDDFAAAEARVAAAEAARAEAEQTLERLQSAAAAAEADAARAVAAHRAARERLDRAEARQSAFDREVAALPDIAVLLERREKARESAEATRAASQAATHRIATAERALSAADAAERSARGPFEAAQAHMRALDAEIRGLSAALAAPAQAKYAPAIDAVRAAPGYEHALAAALGDDLLASLDPDAPAAWLGATPAALTSPKGAEPLSDHVSAPAALAARLALCFVVDAARAPEMQGDLAPGMRLVSRDGDLWRWDGLVRRAGASSASAAQLEQRNRRDALIADLERAQRDLAVLEATWRTAFDAREAAALEGKAARAAAPATQQAAAKAQQALAAIELDVGRAESRRAALLDQGKAITAERAEALAAIAAAPPVETRQTDQSIVSAARQAAIAARAEAVDAQSHRAALLRTRTIRADRRAAIAREIAQWRTRADAANERATMLVKAQAAVQSEIKAAHDAPAAIERARAQLTEDMRTAETRQRAAADALAALQARVREASAHARDAKSALAQCDTARAAAADALDASMGLLRDAEARAGGLDYQALIGQAGALVESPLGRASALEIDKRIERLKGERDAAGAVNLRAEEELSEAIERAAALAREKEDVVVAIGKLRYAIGRLNGEARTRLRTAFEQVNAHFGALFATLFDGGEAALKLTESDDPLAAGLEIYASPPGKKLTALSLMSGGEQALTATALIFAVFLANPAPLCVLDEVDAPLDDANVDRFCRMLEEMRRRTETRFLVITHNPVTMARMDRLFGVTMAEAGVSQLVSVDLQKAAALAAA